MTGTRGNWCHPRFFPLIPHPTRSLQKIVAPIAKHTLRFKSSSTFLGSPFMLDITYYITVQ